MSADFFKDMPDWANDNRKDLDTGRPLACARCGAALERKGLQYSDLYCPHGCPDWDDAEPEVEQEPVEVGSL